MEYSLDTIRDGDLEGVVSLLDFLQHRGREANERYLQWKYFENPFIEDPLISVVRYGGEVVALIGLMGMAWSGDSGQDVEVMPQLDDLIIHPDHRRKGLTRLLFKGVFKDSFDRGYPAMISLSGGNASNAIALATGWTEIRELKRVYLIREDQVTSLSTRIPGIRRIKSKAEGLARRLGYATIAPPTDSFVDAAMEPVPGTNPHVTVSAEADVEAMSALAGTVNRHTSSRSADFLRWRLGNPDRTYRFVYWRDTHLRGYMIVGWTGLDHRHTMIIDHCCDDESVFAELLTAVTRIPRGNIELMASTLPQQETDVAHSLGFQPDPDHTFGMRRFLVYPLAADVPEIADSPVLAAAPSWRVDLIDTLQG